MGPFEGKVIAKVGCCRREITFKSENGNFSCDDSRLWVGFRLDGSIQYKWEGEEFFRLEKIVLSKDGYSQKLEKKIK